MMFQMADDFSPYSTGNDKDKDLDGIIRPHELTDFTGQDKIVTNLKIFIKAAKMRGEPLDHVLFTGLLAWERLRLLISWPMNWV